MVQPPTYQVTQLLKQWSGGDNDALEQLTPLVYAELRRLAGHHLYGERAGHVLQSCDLVNEAFIRLLDWKDIDWHNRAQFFGILSKLMRHVLVDYAREHNAQRRSGSLKQVSLDDAAYISTDQSGELVALDDSLKALERFDP
jgi:RNA polymerase sigma factor (TIGR02999 family)